MNNNIVLNSYCFLAALTESNNDLYQGVFLPIAKRALSLYSIKKGRHGTDGDIQEFIEKIYGINVPIVVIRKLLRGIENDLSRRELRESKLSVLENGKSFQIGNYAFIDLEEKYKAGSRNANALNEAFNEYIMREGTDFEEIPSLDQFFKNFQSYLSGFFNGKISDNESVNDETYIHHVNFLEYIDRNNHHLYKIAENLYLGSVVASFLECDFDFNAKSEDTVAYYLDTQILLEALDLQNEADTPPTLELLNLIKDNNGILKVFDITLQELSKSLEFSIEHFNNDNPFTTINEACVRRGKSKTWLINLNGKLENTLKDDLEIKTEIIPKKLKDKFSRHSDLKALKGERVKESNAVHDVYAYLFVREVRDGDVSVHNKANSWFITANKDLLKFNISRKVRNTVPEISLPDTLTSLLWVQSPKKYLSTIKTVGLSQLLAVTLNEEIASKELISEYDKNIKAIDGINEEDYKILISSVAHQSARYIESLNELANKNPEKFNKEAYQLVEKARKKRNNVKEALVRERKAQRKSEEKNQKLTDRIDEIEINLEESKRHVRNTKSDIEILNEKMSKQGKYVRRFLRGLTITIIIIIAIYLYLTNIEVSILFDSIFTIILGSTGLWAFGSFLINLNRWFKS